MKHCNELVDELKSVSCEVVMINEFMIDIDGMEGMTAVINRHKTVEKFGV